MKKLVFGMFILIVTMGFIEATIGYERLSEIAESCDNGDIKSCREYLRIMKSLCNDNNDFAACYIMGVFYEKGRDVQGGFTRQNYKQAFNYYKKACDGGVAKGCAAVGGFYFEGLVVKKDRNKALEYYGKSCDMGNNLGCEFYAKIIKGEIKSWESKK